MLIQDADVDYVSTLAMALADGLVDQETGIAGAVIFIIGTDGIMRMGRHSLPGVTDVVVTIAALVRAHLERASGAN